MGTANTTNLEAARLRRDDTEWGLCKCQREIAKRKDQESFSPPNLDIRKGLLPKIFRDKIKKVASTLSMMRQIK